MNRLFLSFILCFLISFPVLGYSAQESDNSPLPEIVLPVPESQAHRAYLGLSDSSEERFTLSELDADIVIIELFSMYCPYCQREAPLVNELYSLLLAKGEDRGIKIKMIGLGASNSQFEVDQFAETYEVSFPLFPDQDMSMYKALGGAGTPGFVGYLLKGKKTPVNILRNAGGFYNAEEFLEDVIKNSGL